VGEQLARMPPPPPRSYSPRQGYGYAPAASPRASTAHAGGRQSPRFGPASGPEGAANGYRPQSSLVAPESASTWLRADSASPRRAGSPRTVHGYATYGAPGAMGNPHLRRSRSPRDRLPAPGASVFDSGTPPYAAGGGQAPRGRYAPSFSVSSVRPFDKDNELMAPGPGEAAGGGLMGLPVGGANIDGLVTQCMPASTPRPVRPPRAPVPVQGGALLPGQMHSGLRGVPSGSGGGDGDRRAPGGVWDF